MPHDRSAGRNALWGEALENLSALTEFPAEIAESDAASQTDLCTVLLFRVCDPRIPNAAPYGHGEGGGVSIDRQTIPIVAMFADRGNDGNHAWADRLRRLFSTEQASRTLKTILDGRWDELALGSAEGSSDSGRIIKPLKIAIRTEGKIVFVDPADVIVIEAQGNYVLLQTRSRSHLFRESVSTVAEKLERYGFIRIHRSTIVNQAFVEEIQISRSGEMVLRVKGGTRDYNVSRKYRDALKSIAPCWI